MAPNRVTKDFFVMFKVDKNVANPLKKFDASTILTRLEFSSLFEQKSASGQTLSHAFSFKTMPTAQQKYIIIMSFFLKCEMIRSKDPNHSGIIKCPSPKHFTNISISDFDKALVVWTMKYVNNLIPMRETKLLGIIKKVGT